MEKRLNFKVMLPLKEIVLRKMVISLWTKMDVLVLIKEFLLSSSDLFFARSLYARQQPAYADSVIFCSKWPSTVEDKVKEKVSELALFNSLEEDMMPLVRPIGLQILKWKRTHDKFLVDVLIDLEIILQQLCWTSVGTIDNLKTARKLVFFQKLDIVERYKLACFYCFEDELRFLWGELPDMSKRQFYKKDTSEPIKTELEYYWPYVLEGKDPESSFNQQAFGKMCFIGNTVAAKYFFQKLTNDEKQISLSRESFDNSIILLARRAPEYPYRRQYKSVPDVVALLLSLMSLEQQIEIFQQNSLDVLICFIDWSWQDLLPDFSDQIWSYLPEEKFGDLLTDILNRISISAYCFSKFFQHCPYKFKYLFVEYTLEYNSGSFFDRLDSAEDVGTIKQVFRNIKGGAREMLFTHDSFYNLLERLVLKDQWHVVEKCLRGATSSKRERETLKESLTEFLSRCSINTAQWTEYKFKRVFEILDKIDESDCSKRSHEDETLTSGVKRRC